MRIRPPTFIHVRHHHFPRHAPLCPASPPSTASPRTTSPRRASRVAASVRQVVVCSLLCHPSSRTERTCSAPVQPTASRIPPVPAHLAPVMRCLWACNGGSPITGATSHQASRPRQAGCLHRGAPTTVSPPSAPLLPTLLPRISSGGDASTEGHLPGLCGGANKNRTCDLILSGAIASHQASPHRTSRDASRHMSACRVPASSSAGIATGLRRARGCGFGPGRIEPRASPSTSPPQHDRGRSRADCAWRRSRARRRRRRRWR